MKKPKRFDPMWSPNLVVGARFVAHALIAMSEAFLSKEKK